MSSLFGGSAPAAPPQPTPEEIAKDKLEEDKSTALRTDRQIRSQLNRRGSRSLLSTGLGIPGLSTNRNS